MKRTPCNNARACCDCQHPCRLDVSIPCSPDCENLTDDGVVLLAQCIADGCDAVASLLPEFEDMDSETFLVKFGDTYQIPDFESLAAIENPRNNRNNIGTMVCWLPHPELGDEWPEHTASGWLADQVMRATSNAPYYGRPVYDLLANTERTESRIIAVSDKSIQLQVRDDDEWKTISSTPYKRDADGDIDYSLFSDAFLYLCCENLSSPELFRILETTVDFHWLPLYVRKVSFPQMSTKSFDDVLGGGWTGLIYTTRLAAHNFTGKNLSHDEIRQVLQNEVDVYNRYLYWKSKLN